MLKCNSNKVAHSLIYPLKTSEKLMFSGDIEVRNFIEIALWHECSPVNFCIFLEYLFLRTPLEGCV